MTKVRDMDGKDLEFNFKGCLEEDVIKSDEQQELEGRHNCDFVVYPPTGSALLIEVKDPCIPKPSDQDDFYETRKQFLKNLQIQPENPWESNLFLRAENTVAFVQVLWPDRNRFLYLIVLGLECLIDDKLFDRSVVVPMQDSLMRRIKSHPTLKDSVTKVRLLSITSWNKVFPQYPLHRISASEAA